MQRQATRQVALDEAPAIRGCPAASGEVKGVVSSFDGDGQGVGCDLKSFGGCRLRREGAGQANRHNHEEQRRDHDHEQVDEAQLDRRGGR
jgi:hypothetical protein